MRYIAAYLLSVAAGNAKPTQDQVKKVLEAAGVEVDAAQLEQVITKMNEKSVDDLVEAGKTEMSKVGGAAPSAGAAPAAAAAAAAPQEEVKEEEAAPLGIDDLFDA